MIQTSRADVAGSQNRSSVEMRLSSDTKWSGAQQTRQISKASFFNLTKTTMRSQWLSPAQRGSLDPCTLRCPDHHCCCSCFLFGCVAVAMADKCSVMFRVLSLHVLVCLSVRLSFLYPSFSLPFLVSLSPLPLFPCISSTARVAARHSDRLHLALLIRNPSTMRVHHDSFHVISPPLFDAQLHCALLCTCCRPSSSSRALFSFSLSSLALSRLSTALLALLLLLTLFFLFFQIHRGLHV